MADENGPAESRIRLASKSDAILLVLEVKDSEPLVDQLIQSALQQIQSALQQVPTDALEVQESTDPLEVKKDVVVVLQHNGGS